MDAQTHTLIHGQFDIAESSPKDLHTFFFPLKQQGLNPRSFTVDGNQHVIRFLKSLWPDVLIQRCLIHIQRQGLMWCRMKPKRYDAKLLRKLFLSLSHIHSHAEKNRFLKQFYKWEHRYGTTIGSSPERGWVFSDLKRARSMLLKALPHMFHYLDDPAIPTSTNGIEGYFSRLKSHYRQHRGLAPHKRKNYFAYYFFLKPK